MLFVFTVLVAACDDPPPAAPPSAVLVPIKKATKTRIVKAADKKDIAPEFVYSSVGLRDPFRSYLADLKENEQERSKLVKHQETEAFELDQYRLTGLIFGTSQPKAMVEDPKGVGHTLKVGSRLGRNGGRIIRISSKGITVREQFRDSLGNLSNHVINIRLPVEEIIQ